MADDNKTVGLKRKRNRNLTMSLQLGLRGLLLKAFNTLLRTIPERISFEGPSELRLPNTFSALKLHHIQNVRPPGSVRSAHFTP
jgi:hypothetical protein